MAAQVPLSYDEKKALISSIMRLDGEQMTGVVDIIQSAMPSAACGDGDEVEIPVDELDTYTLRTLQEYVQVGGHRLLTDSPLSHIGVCMSVCRLSLQPRPRREPQSPPPPIENAHLPSDSERPPHSFLARRPPPVCSNNTRHPLHPLYISPPPPPRTCPMRRNTPSRLTPPPRPRHCR